MFKIPVEKKIETEGGEIAGEEERRSLANKIIPVLTAPLKVLVITGTVVEEV